MTIIGIPLLLLLPFAFLGLGIVAVIGFTAVGYRLGTLLMARLGRPADNPYTTTIAGIVLVLSPLLVARLLGLIVPFTFGLGLIGMLLARWGKACLPVVEARLAAGERAVHAMFDAVATTWLDELRCGPSIPTASFTNVNTPEDPTRPGRRRAGRRCAICGSKRRSTRH
jgi:hypothetical protein